MSSSLSSLRAKLRDAQQQLPGLLEACFGREPLLPGCVYKLRRKCGKPNCHCAEGKPHESEVLSYRGDGRAKNVSLPVAELDRARTMTAEYQRVRKARAKLVRWQQKVLDYSTQWKKHAFNLGRARLNDYSLRRTELDSQGGVAWI